MLSFEYKRGATGNGGLVIFYQQKTSLNLLGPSGVFVCCLFQMYIPKRNRSSIKRSRQSILQVLT